jgi:hypothetical protein
LDSTTLCNLGFAYLPHFQFTHHRFQLCNGRLLSVHASFSTLQHRKILKDLASFSLCLIAFNSATIFWLQPLGWLVNVYMLSVYTSSLSTLQLLKREAEREGVCSFSLRLIAFNSATSANEVWCESRSCLSVYASSLSTLQPTAFLPPFFASRFASAPSSA